MLRRVTLLTVLAALLLGVLSACSSAAPKSSDGIDLSHIKMANLADMPAEVQQSSVSVQEAYRFAVANPDVLKEVPCYCGCGAVGHHSNYACYVKSDEGGKITFDQHALGCSICVDIAHDAMRMLSQGKSVDEIKAQVDQTYSQYGQSNMEQ